MSGTAEQELCALCGAQPCHQTGRPTAVYAILADIRIVTGVNEKPMLSELPAAIGAVIATRDAEIARLRERAALTPEMVRLIIAARIVAFEDQSAEALRELDLASEAFAEAVPWDNDPAQDDADDEVCTGCHGSGYDGNREARCHCQPEGSEA